MKHHCEFEKASSVFILVQILKEFKRKRNTKYAMELIVHYCKKHKDNTLSSRAIEQKIHISTPMQFGTIPRIWH